MIDLIRTLIPDFSHFEETVIASDSAVIGYQCVLILDSGYPLAGGTDFDRNVARRICAAEAIERTYVKRAKDRGEATTSCGFAAGFEEKTTIFRACCEAVERWAWSKWIDQLISPHAVKLDITSPLELHFASAFSKVAGFKQPLTADQHLWPTFLPKELTFNAVIGSFDNGIFPGSRVTTVDDKQWEHPLLEAWRHKTIYLHELVNHRPDNIFDARIKHFGQHGIEQIKKIESTSPSKWPQPKLSLLKEIANQDGYFVWRATCSDYIPWEEGDANRFVY